MPERKDIVGEVQVLFKDGGGDIEINLFINCNISAQAGRDSESADTMCKFIKWLFGWTSSYIIENNITDKNGKLFTVPEFKYTKDSFKQGYPD